MNNSDMSSPVISCSSVSKQFDEGELLVEVLNGIDLAINPAEQVAIIGQSGSGKSTLLQLMGGLDTPTEGELFVSGENIAELNEADRGRLRKTTPGTGRARQSPHFIRHFAALAVAGRPPGT